MGKWEAEEIKSERWHQEKDLHQQPLLILHMEGGHKERSTGSL